MNRFFMYVMLKKSIVFYFNDNVFKINYLNLIISIVNFSFPNKHKFLLKIKYKEYTASILFGKHL